MMRDSLSLEEFRVQRRWLCHRDKAPYSAITGKATGWSNPAAWTDHTTATARAGKNTGFAVGDGVVVIDLDHALYVDETGKKPVTRVKPVFKPLYDLALKHGAFIERSLSGAGLHIFLLSDWTGTIKTKFKQSFAPDQRSDKTGIEIYGGREADGNANRFIATTFRTGGCGNAQAITTCDEVLQAARDLAARAEAKGVEADEVATAVRETNSGPVEDDAEDETAAPFTSARPEDGPFYVLNRLAVLAADQWFPVLFPGAKKQGDIWRGRTHDASRGDVSLSPKGVRWWKDDNAKTPVDLVMLFADLDRELTATEAAAWLAERMALEPSALRGMATMLARNTTAPPDDIFAELPGGSVAWPSGVLPEALEAYAACMGEELGVNSGVLELLFLVVCGASVPARIRFQPDPAKAGWVVPATAWAMVLGPSGVSKSPALDAALGPVYDMEQTWRDEHKRRVASAPDDKERDRLRKQGPVRRVTNSATSEALAMLFERQPSGVIMHADELASAFDFGRYNRGSQNGASDSATLLSAYESKALAVDRKGEGRSVATERAHLSLVGGVQPAVLAGMADGLSANGMLQRALVAVMTTGLYGAPCGDDAGRTLYHDVVRQILRLGEVGVAESLIVGTQEVGQVMIDEGNRARRMMTEDPTLSDTIKSVLGKTTGHIARIALWLAMIDWAIANREAVEVLDDDPLALPSVVPMATVQRAIRLWWDFCFPTMLAVYDGAGLGASVVNDARHVGAYIVAREDKFGAPFGSRAFRDIRKFGGQAGMGRLFAALDYLVERRWLRVTDRQASGAPSYVVDDRVWTLFADRAASLQGRWT